MTQSLKTVRLLTLGRKGQLGEDSQEMKKQLGQYCYTQHLDKVENVNKNAILEESNFIVQDLLSPKFSIKY